MLDHGPPHPRPGAAHACPYFVEMPPGTPTGFPVPQVFSEEESKLDPPFAQSLVTDLNAALVESFLNIPVATKRPHGRCSGQEAQGKSVIQPESVLDDGHRKAVAGGFRVSHARSAYPVSDSGNTTARRYLVSQSSPWGLTTLNRLLDLWRGKPAPAS